MSGRMLVNSSSRCTRCGGEGTEGDMGPELWLCDHDVKLCFHCFVLCPCSKCAEPPTNGAKP